MSFRRGPRFKAQRTADSAGVMQASKGQAQWFDRLRLREKAGEISHLELEWEITINGEHICVVKADASYFDEREGRRCIVDYKGIEGDTPVSRLKRKLVAAQHGVTIEIVGPAAQRARRKAEAAEARREIKKRERREAKHAARKGAALTM